MNDKTSLWSACRTDSFGTCPLPRVRRGQQRGYIQPQLLLVITRARFVTTPQNELFLVGCHAASSTCNLATKRPYHGFCRQAIRIQASRRVLDACHPRRCQTWGLPTLARRVGSGSIWTGKLPKSCGRECDHAPNAVC
jgi:hypothetical protein